MCNQGIRDGFAAWCFEQTIRYHIICEHQLCGTKVCRSCFVIHTREVARLLRTGLYALLQIWLKTNRTAVFTLKDVLSFVQRQGGQALADIEGFNSHLNKEQLSKALITLMEIYETLHFQGRPSKNEATFRAYQILVRYASCLQNYILAQARLHVCICLAKYEADHGQAWKVFI